MTEMIAQEEPKKKKRNKPSRWLIFLAGISFGIPVILLYYYNDFFSEPIKVEGIEIKKMEESPENEFSGSYKPGDVFDIKSLEKLFYRFNSKSNSSAFLTDSTISIDSLININPVYKTIIENQGVSLSKKPYSIFVNDSSQQRIMLLGDSEAGGLCFPLNDYCIENGHKLVLTLAWNSSTIHNFANADTIVRLIEAYKPTYIFFVVGLNEISAKDIEKRKRAASLMAEKFRGIPYTWIGPANWMEDNGINMAFKSGADTGTFFLTKGLSLPRGPDGRHPNNKGYAIWMDSIAEWIHSSARYKITMQKPKRRGFGIKSPILTLNAVKFKGY